MRRPSPKLFSSLLKPLASGCQGAMRATPTKTRSIGLRFAGSQERRKPPINLESSQETTTHIAADATLRNRNPIASNSTIASPLLIP